METSKANQLNTALAIALIVAVAVIGFLIFKSQDESRGGADFYKAQVSVPAEDCNFEGVAQTKSYYKTIRSADIKKVDENLRKIIDRSGVALRVVATNSGQVPAYVSGETMYGGKISGNEIYVDYINYTLSADVGLTETIVNDIRKLVVAPDISENDNLVDEILQSQMNCESQIQAIKSLADREWFYLEQLKRADSERDSQPTRPMVGGDFSYPGGLEGVAPDEYSLAERIIQIRQEAQQQVSNFKYFIKELKENKLGKIQINLSIMGFPG